MRKRKSAQSPRIASTGTISTKATAAVTYHFNPQQTTHRHMSNNNEIKKEGNIIAIDDIITFDSGFTKREFVIKTTDEGEYTQGSKFELVKDKTALVDKYSIGDKVTVHFNIRGREWNEKYFVNLVAWRLEGQATATATPAPVAASETEEEEIPF